MIEYFGASEFQVNTSDALNEEHSSVAALSSGDYVITWSSLGPDGSGWDIYAQRFEASGTGVGAEVRVNTYTNDSQTSPTGTGLPNGGYVITWTSAGQDGSGGGVYAQRFNATGVAVGTEFRVNNFTVDDQVIPDVTALGDGGYIIAWVSAAQNGSVWDVYAQRFDASGVVVGSELRVNTSTSGFQTAPAVTGLANGGYVVSWQSAGQDGSGSGIFAQRYDSSGVPAGSEFRVNTFTNGDQERADVTSLADGDFVVTWMSSGQDGSGWGIYAQRFSATGAVVGSEFRVNTTTTEDQISPAVTALVDGGYVVTWTYAPQFTMGGIYAQVYDAAGNRVGAEVRVNTSGNVSASSVDALPDGTFVISWTTPSGVFARQFFPMSSTLAGDGGSNILFGTSDPETIDGQAGADRISGFSGNDVLTGGTGSDHLFGGNGNDIISADRHIGFDGRTDVDHVYGGAGNDVIFAGYGDVVDGGDGFDTLNLSYQGSPQGITGDTAILFRGQPLSPGAGSIQNVERFDAIALTSFNDTMVIGDQADPATAYGWDGDDHLIGQEHRVVLYGGRGNDLLVGSTANDVLYGEDGNDKILGHTGMDELWGGAGADTFYFTSIDGTDRIGDFERGSDKIDVSGIDANTSVQGVQAFSFIGTALFTNTPGQLRVFQDTDGKFYVAGDVNGDGVADLLIDLGSVQVGNGDFIF